MEKKKKKDPWVAFVHVKWKEGTPKNAWKGWEKKKGMKLGWTTTGNWDCSLLLNVDKPEDVEKIVWNEIRKNKWVKDTEVFWAKPFW